MAVDLDDDSRPTYVQVADELRQEIKSGAIRPGERLPSVRDLSERFDIANVTVQSALRVLRDEGYIASRSTRGYFVREELPAGAADQPSADYTSLRTQLDGIESLVRDLSKRVTHLEAAAPPAHREDDRRGSPGPTSGSGS